MRAMVFGNAVSKLKLRNVPTPKPAANQDLDNWIDAMKEGAEMATQDVILGKL